MISGFLLQFNNLHLVYAWITSILSIGLVISSLEDVANRSIYSKTGLLSWKVSKHSSLFFLRGHFSKILKLVLNDQIFHYFLYLKLLLSISLFGLVMVGIISPIVISLLFLLMLLLPLRSQMGLDGAHQMNLVVLFGLMIATIAGIDSKISSLCLWFISGELILSYFVAGLNKAISPIWQKTHALNAIFSTKTYGHETLFRLVTNNKAIAFALCWPMVLFELFFVTSLFSEYTCITFCLIGFGFHLFNAIFMGLNTFLFAFLATYPAVFYCFTKINTL